MRTSNAETSCERQSKARDRHTTLPARQLRAILIADVVGYCRHMERDQLGTHLQVRSLRKTLIEPILHRHLGTVVHRAGDGILVEFDSATAAMAAAVEIQRLIASRNQALAARERIDLRIGVSVGDVLIDGEDVAGCEVNLAARLQSAARPGGICISGTLRDLLHDDFGVRFRAATTRHLKNIGLVSIVHVDANRALTDRGPNWRALVRSMAPRFVMLAGVWRRALARRRPRRFQTSLSAK
jgi:class 3 adenylate cyclase